MNTALNPTGGLYRVLGRTKDTVIEVGADGSVRVSIGRWRSVVPLQVAMALQTQDAIAWISEPSVAAFLYAGSERSDRKFYAWQLTRAKTIDARRSFKNALISQGVGEEDAVILARLKHP